MDSQALYPRILGKDFGRLPAILQRFHSQPQGGCAAGVIAVERGAGALRGVAAQVLGLPRAGREVPLRLQVISRGSKEIWVRHFDGQRLETLQWQEGPYLVEQAGPLHLVFQVAADEHGLTFRPRCSRVRGFQIPEPVSLHINASARGVGDCWSIEVTIKAALLGTITSYKGEVTPQLC